MGPTKKAFKKVPATTKGSTRSEKSIEDLFGKGEIDDFVDKKNKIDLSTTDIKQPKSNIKKKVEVLPVDVSDEEVEDFDDDDEDDYVDDDDEVDFDDDDQDDDMDLSAKKSRKNKDLENKMSWGKEKSDYYTEKFDGEDVSSEDEEEEEKEAIELQKQRAKLVREEDYEEGESFNDILAQKKEATEGKKKKKAESASAANPTMAKITSALDNSDDVELLQKNLSTFSKKEKLQYLMKESPLLFELLDDYKEKISEIKYTLMPLLDRIKKEQLPTTKGVSFLETKYHLLLSYCLNITYFLMLKASGASIKDHPVIDQLVKIRVILEKVKPLDNKLQYQIEKILKTATLGVVSASKDDPMRFKPNLKDMSHDDDEMDEESRLMQQAGLYQAPQSAAERYEEEESIEIRKKNRELKKKERAIKSSMARDIEEMFGDAPDQLDDYVDDPNRMEDDDAKEIREYEENNFVRLTQTKKDKKIQKKKRLSDGLNDLADFNDLSGLLETEEDRASRDDKEYLKKKRMEQIMSSLNQVGKTKRARSGDEDLPLQERKKTRLLRNRDEDNEELHSDHEEEVEYDGVPRGPNDYSSYRDMVDGKRKISKQIETNRGLTRTRKREHRTPHLRHRHKYEAAMEKKDRATPKAERQDGKYRGTKAINSSAVRGQTYLH
ncbi:hypothetical protein SAMD00019534_029370 [Acytostelium subglobosum LB1]|uniref:hypothetical protein n=1 Tax=Acytostelium subglobosum LB1 TaxID=1410327 RepID=UPI0006449062|nr:hypothetical protein SAMD00019534_029370 [Acytostelium subglobosum LB1]GAM19762.1 hypothetical protein SAMD00019534_029370 [Acytostelium subglobosum LB1]|eukprot:XP_012756524.1 hypothetical protein SAMD00019534_029370 [Acytostelium subglobosum LB1]